MLIVLRNWFLMKSIYFYSLLSAQTWDQKVDKPIQKKMANLEDLKRKLRKHVISFMVGDYIWADLAILELAFYSV